MSTEAAAVALQDRAAFWSMGEAAAYDVVGAACDALVAGLDGPGLRALAACERAEAGYDVPDLLPAALGELGVPFCPPGSDAAREAAARALARRVLAGGLAPAEFAFRIHRAHGHALPLTARIAELDDEYGMAGYDATDVSHLDAAVLAEARRLATHPRGPSG